MFVMARREKLKFSRVIRGYSDHAYFPVLTCEIVSDEISINWLPLIGSCTWATKNCLEPNSQKGTWVSDAELTINFATIFQT